MKGCGQDSGFTGSSDSDSLRHRKVLSLHNERGAIHFLPEEEGDGEGVQGDADKVAGERS